MATAAVEAAERVGEERAVAAGVVVVVAVEVGA